MKLINSRLAWIFVIIITVVQLVGFFTSKFSFSDVPLGDAPAYQLFISAFLGGKLDFSLGGFQGASLPAILLHALFPTNHSFTIINLLFAHLSIPLLFIFTKRIFKSDSLALVSAIFWSCIPTIQFSGLYGYPQGVFHFATILTLLLVTTRSRWSGLAWGWSIISKPFAIALFPLFILNRQYKQLLISLAFVGVYLIVEFLSLGRIMIGVHPEIPASTVFHPGKIIYNLLAAPPLLFSIHAFLPFSTTNITDTLQTSPLIIIFSLVAIFYFRPPKMLIYCWMLSLLLPVSLSYLDPNYIQTFILFSILLALPFFKKFPLLLPIAVASTAYQYLYTFLWRPDFWQVGGLTLYLVPLVAVIVSLYLVWDDVKKIPRIFL